MHTFVHVTKSGGTSVERYIKKHLAQYICGEGHGNVCQDNNNPIIIIREPFDRFLSMYRYWKAGSEIFTPSENDNKTTTIKDLILYLKHQHRERLYDQKYIWSQHFAPTCDWIKTHLYNIIAIKYTHDLGQIIPHKLCDALNIPMDVCATATHSLNKINVSHDTSAPHDLDKYDMEFIHEYYKKDFELWDTLCNRPHEFKMVLQ